MKKKYINILRIMVIDSKIYILPSTSNLLNFIIMFCLISYIYVYIHIHIYIIYISPSLITWTDIAKRS
jgi:hypothetical protein